MIGIWSLVILDKLISDLIHIARAHRNNHVVGLELAAERGDGLLHAAAVGGVWVRLSNCIGEIL